MALYLRQNDDRTKLQQRLAAELQEKARQKSQLGDRPDGVDDSAYVRNTKTTSSMAWLWMLISAVAVVAIVMLTFSF